jgi:hypothetical protein
MGRKPNPDGTMPAINVSLRRGLYEQVRRIMTSEHRRSMSETAAFLVALGLHLYDRTREREPRTRLVDLLDKMEETDGARHYDPGDGGELRSDSGALQKGTAPHVGGNEDPGRDGTRRPAKAGATVRRRRRV